MKVAAWIAIVTTFLVTCCVLFRLRKKTKELKATREADPKISAVEIRKHIAMAIQDNNGLPSDGVMVFLERELPDEVFLAFIDYCDNNGSFACYRLMLGSLNDSGTIKIMSPR